VVAVLKDEATIGVVPAIAFGEVCLESVLDAGNIHEDWLEEEFWMCDRRHRIIGDGSAFGQTSVWGIGLGKGGGNRRCDIMNGYSCMGLGS
jgi:hypothetical protein